jgi:hypothetical protein
MQVFTGEYRVQATSARRRIVENLIHAWTTGAMPGDGPQVAIVECGSRSSTGNSPCCRLSCTAKRCLR